MERLRESLAYKLTNTSNNLVCGIPALESKVVLFNYNYFISINYTELQNAIASGILILFDHNENQIKLEDANMIIGEVWLSIIKLKDQIATADSLSPNYANLAKVSWNITHSIDIISIVRSDMLTYGLTKFGINPLTMANKLSPLISLVCVGMYNEALALIPTLERDGFLTDSRLQKYMDIISSANAIDD